VKQVSAHKGISESNDAGIDAPKKLRLKLQRESHRCYRAGSVSFQGGSAFHSLKETLAFIRGKQRMTLNEQREVFYHLIGFILFSSIVLTGYAVILMGLSPLAPHVLWKLVMIAGIVLALTASLSAIFERVLNKAAAQAPK
jgi:hypothetical protein